jgi:hypothetical protein
MYPTSPQYRHSIVNKRYPPDNGGHFFTPILENEEPKYESGNKAIVFKVTDDKTKKTKALKLFLIDNKERFIQYLEISKFLNKFSTQFFVSFNFIEKFIYVDVNPLPEENYFPGLIMEWAEGKTLGSKIQELISTKNKSNLKKIAKSFKDLSIFLLDNNIGHGDLKHDNIIVNEDNNMKLIDYDGIYVPAFNNQISKELGTDSFQHPQRKSTDFNADIDHFSILTIYCSLIALSVNPDLYLRFNDQQNLLFTKEDFLKPKDSELFEVLSSYTETKALAFYIKQSLASESIYIDNLKDLLNGKFPRPSIEISHLPTTPLIGQKVKISWKSNDVDFVKINGTERNVSGSIEEVVKQNHSLDFEYGNAIDTKRESYKFKSVPKPEIVKFSAKTNEIKFDEKIVLNWEARNFKEAKLTYNEEEVDVKNLKTLTIDNLEKDTIFYLKLVSEIDNYQVEKELKVEVYYPVKLEVTQDKKITFPNRPVNIYLESVNSQKVTLKPQNIDLTGKSSYEIITDKDFSGHIVAENKRYSSPIQRIEIEVLKVPQGPQIIAKLPAIEFKISTPQFIRINKPEIRKGQNVLNQFKTAFEFLNIFKISTNLKRLHEARRK